MATSAAEIAAVIWPLVTKVVEWAVEAQYTIDPATKPVPLTVKVKPGLPAVAVLGTRGVETLGAPAAIEPEPDMDPEPYPPHPRAEIVSRTSKIVFIQTTT